MKRKTFHVGAVVAQTSVNSENELVACALKSVYLSPSPSSSSVLASVSPRKQAKSVDNNTIHAISEQRGCACPEKGVLARFIQEEQHLLSDFHAKHQSTQNTMLDAQERITDGMVTMSATVRDEFQEAFIKLKKMQAQSVWRYGEAGREMIKLVAQQQKTLAFICEGACGHEMHAATSGGASISSNMHSMDLVCHESLDALPLP
jgi:hypothetical protein